MAYYNFDIKLHEDEFDIQIDTDAHYGYFERDDGECSGGLWLAATADPDITQSLELVDFDGTFELPKPVLKALRDAGFGAGEDFE